jgi:hypothetical protein
MLIYTTLLLDFNQECLNLWAKLFNTPQYYISCSLSPLSDSRVDIFGRTHGQIDETYRLIFCNYSLRTCLEGIVVVTQHRNFRISCRIWNFTCNRRIRS